MEITEALERQASIDDLYRVGLGMAQQVSAQFYEETAAAYGIVTPTAREAFGLQRLPGRDVEELRTEDFHQTPDEGWSL